MQMDFTGLFHLNFLTVVLSFLFVDVFDTLGGIIGMASQGTCWMRTDACPASGARCSPTRWALSVGAVLGTSTTTTFAERGGHRRSGAAPASPAWSRP